MFKWIGDLGNKVASTLIKSFTITFNELFDSLVDFFETIFEKIKEKFKNTLINFVSGVLINIETDYKDVLKDIVGMVEKIPDLPDEIKNLIKSIKEPKHQVTALIGNTLMSGAVGGTIQGLIGTLLEPVTQRVRQRLKPNPLDLSTIITAYYRGIFDKSDVYFWGGILGYKHELLDLIVETFRPILSPNTYIDAWLRGFISDDILEQKLKENGFDVFQIALIKKLAFYYPPVSDLIRFAVREVFTPDIASKYGLFEDYPQEFEEHAKKVGLSPEFAKWYWGAHWELPSVTMGFEMFHRGIITYEELKTLLRTLDIMPYWREKLIQLSYNVPTRVDVRRIYQLGIRNKEWVFKQYKRLGYNDEDAEALTEFTIRGATEEERDLTKSEVIQGFKEGLLSEEETRKFLNNMGYDENEVNFYITKAKHDLEKERVQEEINIIKTQFQKGVISKQDAISKLNSLNLTSKQVDYYILKFEREKETKVLHPSKKDLEDFLVAGYITIDEYKQGLRELGYPEKWVELYTRYVIESYELDKQKQQ
ncbi:MAG: hypothetical protein QW754_05685 [Thermoplasmata archaeon]